MAQTVMTPMNRKITSHISSIDRWGAVKVRLGIGRDRYRVDAGLYALGKPDHTTPVLVTANYKLTLDVLRSSLGDLSAWILVLDTKGINVWCAAGKGTFGTAELVNRIRQTNLWELVANKTLILPQLGAPGVAAHEVTRQTGFQVVYGPVRASDIPAFLVRGMKADRDMRRVRFTLKDRLIVVPVEIQFAVKVLPLLYLFFLLFHLAVPGGVPLAEAIGRSWYNLLPHAVAFFLGTIGVAALLPYLPGRSFALKGAVLGALWALLVVRFAGAFQIPDNGLVITANAFMATVMTAFFALNFTGSTTFTSLSGVQKETLVSVPIMGVALLAALVMMVIFKVNLFMV
ncbi:MAG: mercury methylation corrinoid protein HgcA [Bacillota bacterium]|nr:mercury methylation corrinoid protein HgcA [Bacillota bacterium]MDW7677155.1 mercury methylation corrinoid protein HgcA [Bacillota bacterium]